MNAPSAQRRAELALAGVTAIWGATFVLVKNALEDASTLVFLGVRMTLAAAVLVYLYRGHLRDSGAPPWWTGVVAGLYLFLGYAFQTAGLRTTTPAKAGFITGLGVAVVPLLCAAVYRVWPHLSEAIGIAVAAGGLALFTWEGESWSIARGDLLVLIAAVAFAAHTVVLAHYTRGGRFERIAVLQIATAAVLSLVFAPVIEQPFFRASRGLWVALGVTAVFATALAFTVLAWAQQHTTATRTAILYSLEPLFAWLASWLATGERLTPRATAGAALILAGILVVELKPVGRPRHPSR